MNDFSNNIIMQYYISTKKTKHLNLSKSQFLFNDFTLPSNLCSSLQHKFDMLVALTKKYVYSCKITEETQPIRIPRENKCAMENKEM